MEPGDVPPRVAAQLSAYTVPSSLAEMRVDYDVRQRVERGPKLVALTDAPPAIRVWSANARRADRLVTRPRELVALGEGLSDEDQDLARAEEAWLNLRTAVTRLIDEIERYEKDARWGAYARAELDHLRKFSLQGGGTPGWWYPSFGTPPEPKVPLTWGFDAVLDPLNLPAYGQAPPDTLRRHTNHGNPDWSTSDESMLMHGLIAHASRRRRDDRWACDLHELVRVYERVRAVLAHAVPASYTLFARAGAMVKPQPLKWVDEDGFVAIGPDLHSFAARMREIWGGMLLFNVALHQPTVAVTTAMAADPDMKHYGHGDIGAKLKRNHETGLTDAFGDDLRRYDQSFARQHLRNMAAAEVARGYPAWAAEIQAMWENLPILLPHGPEYGGPDAAALLLMAEGMVRSGTIDTAKKGTIGNGARIHEVIADSAPNGVRRSPKQVIADRHVRWSALWQGDDTVVQAVPGYIDRDRYASASADRGLESTATDFVTFLSRYYDTASGGVGLLWGRIVQLVFGPEKRHLTTIEALDAYAKRVWLPELGQPTIRPPWAGLAEALCSRAYFFRAWRCGPAEAGWRMQRADAQAALTEALKARGGAQEYAADAERRWGGAAAREDAPPWVNAVLKELGARAVKADLDGALDGLSPQEAERGALELAESRQRARINKTRPKTPDWLQARMRLLTAGDDTETDRTDLEPPDKKESRQ